MAKTVYLIRTQAKPNGSLYDKLTADDDFAVAYPFTDTPLPASLADKPAGYDWTTGWYDNTLQAAQDTAKQAQADTATAQAATQAAESKLNSTLGLVATALTSGTVSDDLKAKLNALYPAWAVGQTYSKGDLVQYNGAIYKYFADADAVATAQTTPEAANYAWVAANVTTSGDVAWKQPTGYQDAYAIGDVVLYTDGKHYKSLIAGNTQVPGSDARYWAVVD